jgi:hypothetical protein
MSLQIKPDAPAFFNNSVKYRRVDFLDVRQEAKRINIRVAKKVGRLFYYAV